MNFSRVLYFVILCVANNTISLSGAQTVSEEYVNETLVLGPSCQARPTYSNFFELLKELIEKDTVLVVLELAIPDVDQNVRNDYRFDLVKTDLGQILLTLKSQMEFLTIDLPLLSDRVDRQSMELIHSPPGCLNNVTIPDTLVKNWILSGLTKKEKGVEYLLVKKVCFEKPYEEPDDWYLFRDTYYHECTETFVKDSQWFELIEDPLVVLSKKILNFGVTAISIVCVITLTIYRRLFHTKACVFLYSIKQHKDKIYDVVKKSSCKSGEVRLFPNHINMPFFEFKCNKSGSRRSDQWKEITTENKKYKIKISGFFIDIEKNALISQNSFGLVFLLHASIDEISHTVSEWCSCCNCAPRLCKCLSLVLHILLFLIISAGVLVPVFLFYKYDPFHTKLDAFVSLIIFIIVPLSMIVTKSTLGFCRHERVDSAQSILLETTFFLVAFFVVAILARVTVIILVGFAFKSGSDIHTLVASFLFFLFLNGYEQLKRTHKKYREILDKCMEHINKSVDKPKTKNRDFFKNIAIPSDQGYEGWPPSDLGDAAWPQREGKSLILNLKGYILFYLPNGETAIDRRFFFDICRDTDSQSPGDLRWTFVVNFVKFVLWGFFIFGILYVQHVVAKSFDTSLYDMAPGVILCGVLPTLFDKVVFPQYSLTENENLTNLLDKKAKEKKTYPVIDFEMNGKPERAENPDNDDPLEPILCIENSECNGCCCFQGEEDLNEQATERNTDENEGTDGHMERAEEGIANPVGNLKLKSDNKGGVANPIFTKDGDNSV